MATRTFSRVSKWGAAVALSGALVVGAAGVSSAAGRPAAVPKASVKIQNSLFMPKTLTIAVGTKVTWTNTDPTGHNATFSGFASPTLGAGKSWSHKFTTVGTFKYHCTLHPEMTGKVVVTAG
jgi:plastocyanin